jgi:lipoprotein-releasing system permease protein
VDRKVEPIVPDSPPSSLARRSSLVPYELFIALRYLRARRRERFISLITVIATAGVAIGVMTLDIVLSIMTGFEEDLRDRILGFTPHVLVSRDGGGAIDDYEQLVEAIRAVPGVWKTSPLVYGQLMLSAPGAAAGASLRGIAPDGEAAAELESYLAGGSVRRLGERWAVPLGNGRGATVQLPGIVLGVELARQLGVEPGSTVNVVSPIGKSLRLRAAAPARRFVVVGTFDAGMPQYDGTRAYVALEEAQQLYGLAAAVNHVEVRVRDLYAANRVAERIRAAVGPAFEVRDWMEENANLLAVLTLQKTAYFVVLLLIVLVAAATIVATLIMVVMDKRKDIAVLKSMGAPRAGIGRIFVWKGIILGVAGTIAGNLGGLAGCWALARYEFIQLPKEVFYVSTVPVKMYPEYFAAVTVAALAICFLATIYPARQAARLAPVDIIRYE